MNSDSNNAAQNLGVPSDELRPTSELNADLSPSEQARQLRASMLACPFCGRVDLYAGMWGSEDGGTYVDRMAAGCESCDVFVVAVEQDGEEWRPLDLLRRAVGRWNTRAHPITQATASAAALSTTVEQHGSTQP